MWRPETRPKQVLGFSFTPKCARTLQIPPMHQDTLQKSEHNIYRLNLETKWLRMSTGGVVAGAPFPTQERLSFTPAALSSTRGADEAASTGWSSYAGVQCTGPPPAPLKPRLLPLGPKLLSPGLVHSPRTRAHLLRNSVYMPWAPVHSPRTPAHYPRSPRLLPLGPSPLPLSPSPSAMDPHALAPGPCPPTLDPPLTPAHSPPCDTHLLSTMATPRSGTVSVVGSKRRRLQHASKDRPPCLLSSYFLHLDTNTRECQTFQARPLQRLPPQSPAPPPRSEVCCTLRKFLYRHNPPVGQRPHWHPVQGDVPRLGRGALLFGIGRVVQPVLGDEELQELWDRNGRAVGARWRRDGRGREGPQGPTQTLDPVSSHSNP